MSKSKEQSAKTQKATNPFAEGISTGGRVSGNTRLTLDGDPQAIKDAMSEIRVKTPQVHKILGYVTALGNTATVAEIDVYCQTATGNLVWGYNEIDLYEQKPSKVLRTYIDMMQGLKAWGEDGKKGTLKVVTVS